MPTNAQLVQRREAAVVRGVAHATHVAIERAEGAEVWDVEGHRFIDFAGGIAVLNTGHRHPKVIAAVKRQLDRFTHPCFQVLLYDNYIELAERLNAIAPVQGPAKTVLFTTGAEATENAVKIARAATNRTGVISFTGAFHGRTMMAMAMTGKISPYKKSFGALIPDVFHIPFPAPQLGISTPEALRHLGFLFSADIDPARVAAIIYEPVQGEGGFHQAPDELVSALRQICDQHGIVLIADEVQTGFGRTGKMFASEHYTDRPDLVCVAKSIAGGFPLSGVIGRKHLMDMPEPGALGSTFAGSPLSCAAALAVLDVFAEEKLLDRANAIGERLRAALLEMSRQNDLLPIANVRGPGAMVAFDLVAEHGSNAPNPVATKTVTQRAADSGLIVLSCGAYGHTIRILVPLTATDEIVDEGLEILRQSMRRES